MCKFGNVNMMHEHGQHINIHCLQICVLMHNSLLCMHMQHVVTGKTVRVTVTACCVCKVPVPACC